MHMMMQQKSPLHNRLRHRANAILMSAENSTFLQMLKFQQLQRLGQDQKRQSIAEDNEALASALSLMLCFASVTAATATATSPGFVFGKNCDQEKEIENRSKGNIPGSTMNRTVVNQKHLNDRKELQVTFGRNYGSSISKEHILATSVARNGNSIQSPQSPLQSQQSPRTCGQWCNGKNFRSRNTKCQIDRAMVPCEGELCTTTCELWSKLVLNAGQEAPKTGKQQTTNETRPRPFISCEMYKNGQAYLPGAVPCDPSCLPKELRKERYSSPTGVGLLCIPGTCQPIAHAGTLECPCNWFSSKCTDDWVPVQRVVGITSNSKSTTYPSPVVLKLHVDPNEWKRIVRHYRPGSVIRINQLDEKGIPRDAVAALSLPAVDSAVGELEVLLGYPNKSIHQESRMVSDRLYNMISSRTTATNNDTALMPEDGSQTTPLSSDDRKVVTINSPSNLYVTPVISGFCNKNYKYLDDYLSLTDSSKRNDDNAVSEADTSFDLNSTIKHLIIVTSGVAIGGALSAVESAPENCTVHLYYGIRDSDDVSFAHVRSRLQEFVESGKIGALTIVRSSPTRRSDETNDEARGVIETTFETKNHKNSSPESQTTRRKQLKERKEVSKQSSHPDAIDDAIERGERLKALKHHSYITDASSVSACNGWSWWNSFVTSSSKIYVQHACGFDFLIANDVENRTRGIFGAKGSYAEKTFGATLQNSIIVICGRSEVLLDMEDMLKNAVARSGLSKKASADFLQQRVFTNV